MEKHVPKLETCQKLKELGYPQDLDNNAFIWGYGVNNNKKSIKLCSWDYCMEEVAGAPLATELLEWLPVGICTNIDKTDGSLIITENSDKTYYISYRGGVWNRICTENGLPVQKINKNFSEALAQMAIYLAEQGIINFKEKQNV